MSISGKVTLTHLKDVLKCAFITKQAPVKLGRWSINKHYSQTGLVVDYSNEDHCGGCGEYIEKKVEKKKTENDDHLYNYELSHMQINTPHK